MSSITEAIQLPSGGSSSLRTFLTRILRIEQQSETVVHGSGGGGKIREKRGLFSDRYEVRGDIAPIQIGSHTEHVQRIWYQDGAQQTYFEVPGAQATGLEGHALVLVVKDGRSIVAAYNIDANETFVWGPFIVPPATVGTVLKRAALAVLAVGVVLAFFMKETTWTWVMLGPLVLAAVWAYGEIGNIHKAERDDKVLEEAAIRLITEVTGGRVGRNPNATLVESPAGTALLR